LIANRDTAHIGTDGVDDSRGIGAEHPWWGDRHSGQAGDDEEIEMIECRRAYANANVRRTPHFGYWEIIAQLDAIEPAMTGDRECLHAVPADTVIFRPSGKLDERAGTEQKAQVFDVRRF
jgi:hypothetical protein